MNFQKIAKMKSIDYVFVKGRRDSQILYVPGHKCLYVKKRSKKNSTDYVCYQTILVKNKAKSANVVIPHCTASVKIDNAGICSCKTNPHNAHVNHEKIYKDFITNHNFLDDVVSTSKMLEDLPVEVSNRDIFSRELAK